MPVSSAGFPAILAPLGASRADVAGLSHRRGGRCSFRVRPRTGEKEEGPISDIDRDAPDQEPRERLPAGKRRIFALTLLALPFLVLAGAEAGLRLVGFGSGHPLFVPADSAGEWLRMNPTVSERYFWGDLTAPGATYDPFRASKQPGTLRIVVQGGSSALGFPFFYGAAFPRMLEARLQETFPDREVEVVNTALTAVNSHTLLDFADEIVEQDPDAVLVYAGHNEYYGAFGVGSTRSGGETRFVSTYLRLRRLRLVQAMSHVVQTFASRGSPGEANGAGGTTMERMVGEREIPLGSELYQAGLDQFERNLGELLSRYARAGIPVYVATLVSNERDQPPFISRADPAVDDAVWEGAFTSARAALAAGDPAAAAAGFEELESRDRLAAARFYRAAALLDSSGARRDARDLYLAAKDRDLLRFRAPEAVNGILRERAAERGARVVEVQRAFVESSPDSIVGGALITEHLHPTIDGYFVMADAFFEALRADAMFGSWEGAPARDAARREAPVTVVDSLYGVFLVTSLTAGWPFQDDPEVERRILDELRDRRPADPVEGIALALFRRQIPWPGAMIELYGHYRGVGLPERAAHVARVFTQELPLSGPAWELRAMSAMDEEDLEAADLWLERGREVEPTYRNAMLTGSLRLRQGRPEDAVSAFEEAARRAPPSDPTPRAVLGAARRLPELDARVRIAPNDPDALHDLASALAMLNLADSARTVVGRLLEVEPGSERASALLEALGPGER